MTCTAYQCTGLNIFPHINFRVIIRFRCRMEELCRYRWLCGLRSESAAARLLGLRVRIPPEPYICLSLGMLCAVRKRPLRRADHSSRGVVQSVIVMPR